MKKPPAKAGEQCGQGVLQRLDVLLLEAVVGTLKVNFLSPRAEKILGRPTSPVLSEPGGLASLLYAEGRDSTSELILAFAADRPGQESEFQVLVAGARVFWLRTELCRVHSAWPSAPFLRNPLARRSCKCRRNVKTGRQAEIVWAAWREGWWERTLLGVGSRRPRIDGELSLNSSYAW